LPSGFLQGEAADIDFSSLESGALLATLDRASVRGTSSAERGGNVHLTLHREDPMETTMLITIVDETTGVVYNDVQRAGHEAEVREPERERLTRVHRITPSAAQRQVRYADGGIPVVDDRMRIPSFVETCPHIADKIIPLNGGRFNVDHYLRVLRAKAEIDASVAMALTARPGESRKSEGGRAA
jgi:hypothetical protein